MPDAEKYAAMCFNDGITELERRYWKDIVHFCTILILYNTVQFVQFVYIIGIIQLNSTGVTGRSAVITKG